MTDLTTNVGKSLTTTVGDIVFARIPVKTHVITPEDDIVDVAAKYTEGQLREGDVVVFAEKAVAITQGRAFAMSEIKPSRLAGILCRFVQKSPHGIGLRNPLTMELAIREAGVVRILFAALAAAITKPFGLKGVFYRISGRKVAAIDGPNEGTLPPYDDYAVLAPLHPQQTAQVISDRIGSPVAIIDANDLGVEILGSSANCPPKDFLEKVLSDNPLGQSTEQTPIGIIRKVESDLMPGDQSDSPSSEVSSLPSTSASAS